MPSPSHRRFGAFRIIAPLALGAGLAAGCATVDRGRGAADVASTVWGDGPSFEVRLEGAANREAEAARITWEQLSQFSRQHLDKLANSQQLSESKLAWVLLAQIARDYRSGVASQLLQYRDWLGRWPKHAAALHPPPEFSELEFSYRRQPRHIAVMLPLNEADSQAGRHVLDGIFGAYYSASYASDQHPTIEVFDTSGISDERGWTQFFNEVYRRDFNLVIGPLRKRGIVTLCGQSELPLLTLALNDSPACANRAFAGNLYRLSLNVGDEIQQLVELLRQRGLKRPLVVAQHQAWSGQALGQFKVAWREAGGGKVLPMTYQNSAQLAQTIQDTLIIGPSEKRAASLRAAIGTKLAFTPRRRKDVDSMVLFTGPQQARFTKALLDFYHADDLPAYALSRIFSGLPQPEIDVDINGVVFTEMPWLIDRFAMREEMARASTPASGFVERMRSLGADAFWFGKRLIPHIERQELTFFGGTGKLRLHSGGRISRELMWAQMRGGAPQMMSASEIADERAPDVGETETDPNGDPQPIPLWTRPDDEPQESSDWMEEQ